MPRKVKKKYHYLYRTTNMINGKYYVGIHSTYKIKDGYLGSGTRLWNAIYKYGKENFIKEELEFFDSREELLQREKEIVNEQLLQDPLCMNLKGGGNGGLKYVSKESLKKIKDGASKWINEKWKDQNYKKKMIEVVSKEMKMRHERGEVRYDTFKNKKHSEESKRKIGKANSINQKGEKNSQFGTCWICNNEEVKKIKKTELDIWLNKGWKIGRSYE